MRPITGFVLIFLCALSHPTTGNAQGISDRERDKLRGPARSIRVELAQVWPTSGRPIEINRRPHQQVTYNEAGFEIERINFNADGSLENRTVQRYEGAGRKTGWEEYYGDARESPHHRSDWFYNEAGNLIEVRVYNGTSVDLRILSAYDEHGRKFEESRIADNGLHIERTTHEYNAAGQPADTTYYFNDVLNGRTLRRYDAAGRLQRETHLNGQSPNSVSTTHYFYDDRGRETEKRSEDDVLWNRVKTSYDALGRVAKRETLMGYKSPNVTMSHAPKPGTVTFRYDNVGRQVEEASYDSAGALVQKRVSTFNAFGALVEEVWLSADPNWIARTSFVYDSHGNCIKTTTSTTGEKGNQTVSVEHRFITYY